MRITVLAENTCNKGGFETEHGLSLYIETERKKILFDMGQTGLFAENAKKMDVDLSEIDVAILSHGHYDHGGGIETFICLNSKAPIYTNVNAFGDYYNGTEKYIGLDKKLRTSERFIFVDDAFEIDNGMTLFSCNNRKREFDLGSFGLTKLNNDEFLDDDFFHEQYLMIEEKGKRILISGCSHKGILNIEKWFSPDVLVGGFHFSKLPLDETLGGYADFLNSFETKFYTCHCTGVEQFEFMKKRIKNLEYISTGDRVDVL